MPIDGASTDGPDGGEADNAKVADAGKTGGYEAPPPMTDEELLKDYSLLKTVGTEEALAEYALKVLNDSLETGKMSMGGKDMSDEQVMKCLKAIGIYTKLKNLCPTRTSVLPVKEFDLSGNALIIFTPHAITGVPEVSQRSLQPLQLVVQFVRVSTDAKVVRLEDCSLQGTTHDKDDKIEQEIIRLVKKFGAGKEARYAREVSLAGNKLEADFAKKVIEAAFWERVRHPDKENPPKLFLDLRRNRIRGADKVLDDLRAGQNAGGSISVAASTDPEEDRNKALIVVDLSDQVNRSVTPMKVTHVAAPARPRAPAPRASSRSPPPRDRSPPRRYTRSPSPARRRDDRSPSPARRRDDRGGDRRGAKRGRDARDDDYDDYDYDDGSRSPTPKRRVRRRRARGGGGGGRRGGGRRDEDSRSPPRERGGGGRRRRR